MSDDTIRSLQRQLLAAQARAGLSPYVLVRGRSSGVFAGCLLARDGPEVTLGQSRRLWRWAGAASLSELASLGPGLPGECKFPVALPQHEILDAIEILPVSDAARLAIESVPVWSTR